MNNKLQKLIEEYEDALYSDFFTVDNTEWDDEYLVYCGDIKTDAADMVVMIEEYEDEDFTEEEFNALAQYIVDGWENGDGKIWDYFEEYVEASESQCAYRDSVQYDLMHTTGVF